MSLREKPSSDLTSSDATFKIPDRPSHNLRHHELILPPTQNLATAGGIFGLLDQNGPFALQDSMTRKQIKEWRDSLGLGERINFLTTRSRVYSALGVKSLLDVDEVFEDPVRMEEARTRANRSFAERFGIYGSDGEIANKIRNLSTKANNTRNRATQEIRGSKLFEQSNEVASADNIADLLRLRLRGADTRIKFEAELKLEGMKIAALNDQRAREESERRLVEYRIERERLNKERIERGEEKKPATGTESNFLEFQRFLDAYVLKSGKAGGDVTILVSHHNPEDFSCETVSRLPQKQVAYVMHRRAPKGTKYTPIKERVFEHEGRSIQIYSTERLKDDESSDLKLFRKRKTNPAVAVEDTIGLLAVLKDEADIEAFVLKLMQGAENANLQFEIDELEDSLSGSSYSAENAGSSTNFRALKFLATIGSMRVEFLIFDHQAYIDNLYRDGVSHEEVQARRIFESGVAKHFFPESIYGVNLENHRQFVIQQIRRDIRLGVTSR